MSPTSPPSIRAAEVLLPCRDLAATQAFFTERLGFRLDAVFPADSPRVVVLSGHGLRLRLESGPEDSATTLRLHCDEATVVAGAERKLRAPNGTRVELVDAAPPPRVPPLQPAIVVSRAGEDSSWNAGRAGMEYRDLIPNRLGGRYIASHVRIPTGGPVGDWVHFHRVRFQVIYCLRGWARLVYEGQGEPFVLAAGDCVLQPPEIRHRVLECSDGLEVVEVGCPAEHETLSDHELILPTPEFQPERDFGGQRFLRHEASRASWTGSALAGFESRDLGLAGATEGLLRGSVLRRSGDELPGDLSHEDEFRFAVLLAGSATWTCEGRDPIELGPGDCWTVPAGLEHGLVRCSDDLELLELSVAAA